MPYSEIAGEKHAAGDQQFALPRETRRVVPALPEHRPRPQERQRKEHAPEGGRDGPCLADLDEQRRGADRGRAEQERADRDQVF